MLLLSLEGEDVLQAVQLLFEVFSDEGDCSLTEEEFMELFTPFAARDRLMKGVDGFVEKLTAHLQETYAPNHQRPTLPMIRCSTSMKTPNQIATAPRDSNFLRA